MADNNDQEIEKCIYCQNTFTGLTKYNRDKHIEFCKITISYLDIPKDLPKPILVIPLCSHEMSFLRKALLHINRHIYPKKQ